MFLALCSRFRWPSVSFWTRVNLMDISPCWASYLGSQHDATRSRSLDAGSCQSIAGASSYWSISAARARAQQQTSCTSLLLSMDTRDRRTDRRTPDRYIDAYCMLCGLRQKSEPVCLSVCLFLCSLFAAAVFSRTKLNLACGILYAPGGQEGVFQRHRATPRAPLDPNDRCFVSVAEAAWRKWAVVNW